MNPINYLMDINSFFCLLVKLMLDCPIQNPISGHQTFSRCKTNELLLLIVLKCGIFLLKKFQQSVVRNNFKRRSRAGFFPLHFDPNATLSTTSTKMKHKC